MSNTHQNERGLALVITVFTIALAMVLVINLSETLRYDRRSSRRFSETLQANYVLKSSMNFGRILLELPKAEGIKEDWLGEPWNLIGAAPALPIGTLGTPRMMIVDESGKVDLNSVFSQSSGSPTGGSNASGDNQSGDGTTLSAPVYWQNVLRDIFAKAGFQREQYKDEDFRTPGNIGYDAATEVAVLRDWIDKDRQSYVSPQFESSGVESSADKLLFFNRRLRSIQEALMVPGMTLERVERISRLTRVATSYSTAQKINVNTAPYDVLLALGFTEAEAFEMIQERTNLPITKEILTTLTEGNPQLRKYTAVKSNEFSIFARVSMPSITRWVKATVSVRGSGARRRTVLRALEMY